MKHHPLHITVDEIRARRLFYYIARIGIKGRNILLILLGIVIIGGLLLSLLDGKTILEGQYLAFITALTVGYGDLSPESWPARLVSVVISVNGILLTGVLIAFVVKALELTFREDIEKLKAKDAALK